MCLLKNTAQLEKRDIFMKNGNEIWDVFGMGRDRKILTGLRTNQIAGFVTVPSEKKKKVTLLVMGFTKGENLKKQNEKREKKLKNR